MTPAIAPVLAVLALAAEPAELRAVAVVVPPAVMQDGGRLTGFSVELWDEVAARLGARTRYRVVADAAASDEALRRGEADVAVTGAFYSLEREREFDFTYPILDSGLQVMVRGDRTAAPEEDRPLRTFGRVLFSRTMLYWVLAALVLALGPAHLFWLLDRRKAGGITSGEPYFPGILHAMEWSVEAMMGQAFQQPAHRVARLLAPTWLLVGVVYVALLTAHMTAAITVERLRASINGPNDLRGRSVATLAGTPAAGYLRAIGARVAEVDRPEDLFAAVAAGRVEAAVFAAPALRYYASHEGAGRVSVVGPEFRRAELGFVVPLESPLRRKIDASLLAMRDDGSYQRIHDRWFGQD